MEVIITLRDPFGTTIGKAELEWTMDPEEMHIPEALASLRLKTLTVPLPTVNNGLDFQLIFAVTE